MIDPAAIIAFMNDCNSGGINGGGHPDFLPADIVAVTFFPNPIGSLTGTGNPATIHSLTVTNNDFVDANGYFTSPAIPVSAGLNRIGVQLSDNSYVQYYYESPTASNTPITQSSIVEVNIYEVPIQGNKFNLELTAAGKMACTYELYDFSGNLLHSEVLNLDTNQTLKKQIHPANGIPNGQLVNKFIFNDGSQVTKMIRK